MAKQTAKKFADPNAGLELLDNNREVTTEFSIGESMSVRARGLQRGTVYSVDIYENNELLFRSDIITDRNGRLGPVILWPHMGLDDPRSEERFTLQEAASRWSESRFTAVLSFKEAALLKTAFRFLPGKRQPIVVATDKAGRLLNGYQFGEQDLYLTLAHIPARERARVFMVHRRHDWHVGNRFVTTAMASGKQASTEIKINPEIAEITVPIAKASNMLPGTYDLIVRPVIYGYEDNDAPYILPRDIIGSRDITGLVVREDFWTAKPVLGGCVNKLSVSGRSVSGTPYFRYSNTFASGEDVWGALDPGIVDPGNISKMCAFYVIPSKTSIQWNSDNSLSHLPVLGGNTAVQKLKLQSGCINANKRLLWPNATALGSYDIVADFGNNVPDAASFVQDDQYDTPLDIIDGYFTTGFRVVNDPATMADFVDVGNWNYTESTQGSAMVQDENSHYHTPGSFTPVNVTVNRRAHVFFPTDAPGMTDPSQISGVQSDYPLVVIVHGNGHSYTSYDFLLEHLARNGFIAVSIHLNTGMSGLGRANMLFEHLTVLQTAFGSTLHNNIGIMGHSRGGEGVVKAARLNFQNGLGYNINAIISLAPTDQYGSEVLSGSWSTPYFVLYGSRDGDITGGIWTPGYTVPQTGFALYDRADGSEKSMVFVYRATHNGFITSNVDGPWDGENLADLEDVSTQQTISLAYMNAFFRKHLQAESEWHGMFTGEWTPPSVEATGVELYQQYQDTTTKLIDSFEGGVPNWQVSTIGGTVTDSGTLPAVPSEGKLHDHLSDPGLDNRSPHDSKGMLLRWNNPNDELVFDIPPAHKDVSNYAVLSLRVSQREASPHNAANQPQNLRVRLKDGTGNERAIRVSAFSTIPYPDQRANASHRKSAMHTIRIPLTSYTIVCAGQPQVDLTDIVSLSFIFYPNSSGEIEVDSIEFSN